MKTMFKAIVVIVEWAALATAITFGCAIGGEAASAMVDSVKKKKKGGESIIHPMPEKVKP